MLRHVVAVLGPGKKLVVPIRLPNVSKSLDPIRHEARESWHDMTQMPPLPPPGRARSAKVLTHDEHGPYVQLPDKIISDIRKALWNEKKGRINVLTILISYIYIYKWWLILSLEVLEEIKMYLDLISTVIHCDVHISIWLENEFWRKIWFELGYFVG